MKLLERDLMNNASERLRQWIQDTIMRCEAVDLDRADTVTMIISCLTTETINSYEELGLSLQDFLTVMQHAWDTCKKHKAQSEKSLATGRK